jgi:hypothetical protein
LSNVVQPPTCMQILPCSLFGVCEGLPSYNALESGFQPSNK